MKKYFFSFSAIVLAICFSAFGSDTAAGKKHANENKLLPQLYWYEINSDGTLGIPLNDEAQMDKDDALGFTTCEDNTSTDCVRGYSSPQTGGPGAAPGTVSDPDYHILKTE